MEMLKLHIDVNFHENIIKFCGITKTKTDQTSDYILVLEYANSGTLKTYLKEHFNYNLGWDDKLELAIQLSNAILCLHESDIICYLYTKCWKGEPNEHPDIREVVLKLQTISFKRDDTSFIDTNEENVTTMEISKEFSDMNQDLLIDNIPNMIGPKSTSSCSIIMEHENHLSVTLSTDSFELAVNNINNSFINNLIQIIIKKHDKGTTFDIIQKLVNQQMLQLNRNIDKLVKDFIKNQYKVDWEGRLGWDTKPPSERLIMLITKDKDIKVVGMLQSVLAAAILRAADRINS
ncbi:unnamed protein product [Rhizophagus irregularis]|nr:unnamed protein product [Rhizophagus irregularis]